MSETEEHASGLRHRFMSCEDEMWGQPPWIVTERRRQEYQVAEVSFLNRTFDKISLRLQTALL